jgi:hypothetical protein
VIAPLTLAIINAYRCYVVSVLNTDAQGALPITGSHLITHERQRIKPVIHDPLQAWYGHAHTTPSKGAAGDHSEEHQCGEACEKAHKSDD